MSYKGNTHLFSNACHHYGARPVWPDARVHAAKASEVYDTTCAVVLDCTGKGPVGPRPIVVKGDRAPALAHLAEHAIPDPTYITLDWPDGGTPPVRPSFWLALAAELHADPALSLVVCCMGSHGRTGTALVALRMAMIAEGYVSAKSSVTLVELVEDVRVRHCRDAVETAAQVTYLRGLASVFGIAQGIDEIEGSYTYRYTASAAAAAPATIGANGITYAPGAAAKVADTVSDWLGERADFEANRDLPASAPSKRSTKRAAKKAARAALKKARTDEGGFIQ